MASWLLRRLRLFADDGGGGGGRDDLLSSRRRRLAERALRSGVLLHGELLLYVDEARGLPDTDWLPVAALKKCLGRRKTLNDPYVAAYLDSTRVATSAVMYNCVYWSERFAVPVCHRAKTISLRIRDQVRVTDLLGAGE